MNNKRILTELCDIAKIDFDEVYNSKKEWSFKYNEVLRLVYVLFKKRTLSKYKKTPVLIDSFNDFRFVSRHCEGSVCIVCGDSARHKIQDVVFIDEPHKRTPNSEYLCHKHYMDIFGQGLLNSPITEELLIHFGFNESFNLFEHDLLPYYFIKERDVDVFEIGYIKEDVKTHKKWSIYYIYRAESDDFLKLEDLKNFGQLNNWVKAISNNALI